MAEVPKTADVVIVGAGLAGLACARVVAANGLQPVVLEVGDGVGGRVRTDVVDGFRLDRGFQVLLTAYPEAATQLDLAALDLKVFDPAAMVRVAGAWAHVADPMRQPRTIVHTLRAPVGTLADKLRLARLRRELLGQPAARLLRGPDVSTMEALTARGFSREIVDRFFRPLLGGIQLDPDLATSARMFEVLFRTLALGDSAVPADGMGAISQQLAAGLPEGTIHVNAGVRQITGTLAQLQAGGAIKGKALVVAADGPRGAGLLGLVPPSSRGATALWFSPPEAPWPGKMLALDGNGQGPVLNLAPLSTVAPSYAPPGRHLLAAACPGVASPDVEEAARRQLSGWFGSIVEKWELLRLDVITHAQPGQRPPFGPKRRVRLGGRRYVCGDWRDTASIQGALFSGRRCGEALVADLHRRFV